MQYLIISTKGAQGWAQSKITPTTSPMLNTFERDWLQWMQQHGEDVVTVGDTIIQLKTLEGSAA
jgi:hypothetical protein